jgi:hypothetical protein
MGRTDPPQSLENSDGEIIVSDYLIPSNSGYYDYQDPGKSVPHDSEGIESDEPGRYGEEVDSGVCEATVKDVRETRLVNCLYYY